MQKNTVILNRLSEDRADLMGLSRFLNNDAVHWQEVAKANIERTEKLVKGKHVLVLNDTSEINYQHHANYLSRSDSELGPTGNNTDIGFFIHPGLVVDAELGIGLGFSYLKIWNRSWDKATTKQRNYKRQDIEDKESYRWIECGLKSKELLNTAQRITIIADRESDIYEEFAIVPDERTDVLIRSRGDRSLIEGKSLYAHIANIESCGSYELKVRTSKNRTGRDTIIEIKYSRVKIKKPGSRKIKKVIPEWIEINIVEAKEVNAHLPTGEKPIHWVLLTTHKVNSFEDAFQIVRWYALRWQIELLFATLKSKGLDLESSELESGKALKTLCVMALQVALQINQLRQARNDRSGIPAQIAFTNKQVVVLKILVKKYERKTEKQKNPHKENTLAWAAWVISRMGGWKGYANESPPGNKTLKAGIDRFNATYEGYVLHEKMCA